MISPEQPEIWCFDPLPPEVRAQVDSMVERYRKEWPGCAVEETIVRRVTRRILMMQYEDRKSFS